MKKYTYILFCALLCAGFFFPTRSLAATETTSLIRQDCAGYAQCYTSLSAWESSRQRDLVAGDEIEVARIEGIWTAADATPVSINGWTTDATHYIKIHTAPEARHGGKWDDTKYRISSGSWGARIIENNQNYTKIEGVQVLHSGGGGASIGIYSVGFAGVVVKDSIARKTSTIVGEGIKVIGTSAASSRVINSVAYGGWNFGIDVATSDGYGYAYNTTSYGNNYGYNGFYIQNLKNCIGASNAIADFARQSSYAVNTTTCASSDATATAFTDAGSRTGQTFGFVDPANGNFHLSSADASAKNMGTDLSSDSIFAFVADIDGETRSGSWDIGADEYGATNGEGGSVPPPVVTDTTVPSISNGSPSGMLASSTTQATLAVTTNESATCGYAPTANNDYLIMAGVFITTNGTTHTSSVAVRGGQSYVYYVRCRDTAGNTTMDDHVISFSVATQSVIPVSSETTSSGSPAIFYTDIVSGPNTGGQNNKGVFVRVFGKNFGAARGTSQVTIGGGAADNYPAWSDGEISFQLGDHARTGNIVVTTQHGASNGVSFTVRSGNIYFVDASSLNDPGTGTHVDPWRSPSSFYNNAQPGDTMYMRGGVYAGEYGYKNWGANFAMRIGTGSGFTRSGTEAMPIAYLAYPGEGVTLSATGPTGLVRAFRIAANSSAEVMPDWIVVGNFAMESYNACIANGGNPGIYGIGWRIVNNDCLGLTTTQQVQTGSIVPGGDHSRVLGNAVHGGRTANKLDHAIYSQACGDQVEIGWNHIYDNSFDSGPLISINYEGTRCTARGDGYAGAIYVHDNIIDATTYPSRGVYAYEQDWDDGDPILPITYVYNNIFIGAGGPGANGALVVRNGGMEAYNNSFYNTNHTCVELSGPTPNIEHLVFKNNICHMKNTATTYIGYPQDAPSVRDVRDNIYFGLGGYTGTLDVHPINADPLYENPASGFFSLQAGSPGINAGSSLASTIVTKDHNGIARPQGSAYDIGAYEYCTACVASSASASTSPAPTPTPTTTTPSSSTPSASQSTSTPTTTSAGGGSPTPASSSPLVTQTQTVASSGITEGSLIRGPDGIKVYIVNAHGYKRHIFNPDVFSMYGHFAWNKIKEVDQQTPDFYKTSDIYRADGDTKVFFLYELDEKQGLAQKRWFNTSADVFQQLGHTFQQVFIINQKERDYYQEGMPITG